MKTSKALFVLILMGAMSSQALSAGNGSSGVGKVAIDSTTQTQVADHKSISNTGNDLIDLNTGEKLIHIDHVSKSSLSGYGTSLAPSTLGQLNGYEYLPNVGPNSVDQKKQKNFWVICHEKSSCLRLTPLSTTNSRVLDIIGGLQKAAGKEAPAGGK